MIPTIPHMGTVPAGSASVYLGPAKVAKVMRHRVLLTYPDQQVWATLALAVPYEPSAGDTVLAISQEDRWYVIGVLEGKGTTTITAAGDLEIRAPHGEIRLMSGQGVRIKSRLIALMSDKLDLAAASVSERFGQVKTRIKQTYQLTAGSLKTLVATTFRLRAQQVVQSAEDDVKIDGQHIRLG